MVTSDRIRGDESRPASSRSTLRTRLYKPAEDALPSAGFIGRTNFRRGWNATATEGRVRWRSRWPVAALESEAARRQRPPSRLRPAKALRLFTRPIDQW